MWMRTIKSDEEIRHITLAAGIADIGGAACVEAIAAGVPEHEVALASTAAMVREIADSFEFAELMDLRHRSCADCPSEFVTAPPSLMR